ncbi:KAT8 regulatory NSL complex subunit 1-like protein isoform X4 [Xyrichtys novacula]|uniref:KAT8 regulatory NSL complex subunit 1-like protein isoform X4 n=1 Tax=Xyrichtys novacula TaxID=13765 RepID=A0AAV1H1G3_XYRNO|nr:KAT8 regulatory NSL complex subunit 1-like protein isoform X4 [Xyrichtys novacula]
MAPALTKVLKDGHGIHLSSPPASVKMDSDGLAMPSTDPNVQLISTDDEDLQKMWLNLSLIPSLDFCLPMSPLDIPATPALTPCLQVSPSQGENLHFPSSAHLLSLLSSNKGLKDSQQVASMFPGVPDMFLVPGPEYNSQEASLLQGCSAVPDGGDVHYSSITLPHSYSFGEKKHTVISTPQPLLTQEKEAEVGCCLPSSEQPCRIRVSSDQVVPRTVLGEAVKKQLCRQTGLCSRAKRLQTRLHALLGEHALLHCNQQLEGLKQYCQLGAESFESVNSIHSGTLPPQVDLKSQFSWQESCTASLSFEELREFSHCSQAVLRDLQEALDSEATASSSSDEEEEEEDIQHFKSRTLFVSSSSSSSCERHWLEERAELGSRWSWLQVRLTELEGRIQQLVGLHKHIRTLKGGVVLAESQPMTEGQIQHTLLRKMVGLSGTASDADTEPCSPARLLHNIKRQSAQLSRIVNSLMPPLSFSPLSKQPQSWRGKERFTSGQDGDVFISGSFKRRRLGIRRLYKADSSCVCARTRPLVTYHKPRLFSFNTLSSKSSQNSGASMSTISSSLSSSSCSCCSSCNPVVVCSNPDCSSSRLQLSWTPSSSSFDTHLFHPLKGTQGREEWILQPLVINAQAFSPTLSKRRSSTPLHNSHKNKQHARRHNSRVMGLSPIRMAGATASQHRRTNQRKRRKRCFQSLMDDEEDVPDQLCDPEDSSDDIQEDGYTQALHKQLSRACVRKRQGESVYNINNIVIPMSVAKVEKLQYKDILTPSWRVVNNSSLIKREEEKETSVEEEEDLTDEVFVRRHLALEQREKKRWSSWGKRKCFRRYNRSGSRLSSSGGGMCTSGEESSVEWSCAQLDADEQQSPEEWLPQMPWEPRVFPLGAGEEDALLLGNLEKVPSGWSDCRAVFSTSKNLISQLPSALSSSATLPSSGQRKNCTLSGS